MQQTGRQSDDDARTSSFEGQEKRRACAGAISRRTIATDWSKNVVLQRNMTIERDAFASLSDDQVIIEVQRLAAAERGATTSLIRSLMELDTRRLYLREGCSSLFTYCTQVLPWNAFFHRFRGLSNTTVLGSNASGS